MLDDVKQISPRQQQVLFNLAAGRTTREVANEFGYHESHISRLKHSAIGQDTIWRLRAQAEERLAEELPTLVSEATKLLKAGLASPNYTTRLESLRLAVKLLGPLMQRLLAIEEPIASLERVQSQSNVAPVLHDSTGHA